MSWSARSTMASTFLESIEALILFREMADTPLSRPAVDQADDDIIYVVCPGEVNGATSRAFTMKRSSLQRSKPLDDFFNSKNYRFGCGMSLYFTQLPAACFVIIKEYLDKGSDRYTKQVMTTDVNGRYSGRCQRLEVYTRLHKSAGQLELHGLQHRAWAAINDEGTYLTIGDCVNLSSFIFANKAGFGRQLKAWLMGHIKENFDALNTDPVVGVDPEWTWTDLIATLSPAFREAWKQLVFARETSDLSTMPHLSIIPEEAGREKLLTKVLQTVDDAEHERAKHGVKSEKEEILSISRVMIDEVDASDDSTTDDDEGAWEDLDHLCPGPETPSRISDDSKARAVLGLPSTPRSSISPDKSPRPSSIDLETIKARSMMGINSPSRGTIAGRRTEPTALTRAIKSFSNFKH